MKTANKNALAAMALISLLGGCTGVIGMGSEIEQGPVSAGPTIKELKATPCACTEIPMSFDSAI